MKTEGGVSRDESLPLAEQCCGGIMSEDRRVVYFCGIIDILTVYNFTKRLEHLVKAQLYGNSVSCIPPDQYAERFMQYMRSIMI